MGGREPEDRRGRNVAEEGESPVGEWLGALIDGQAGCGFGGVGREGDTSAEQDQHPFGERVDLAEGGGGEDGRADGADESVDRIPNAVDPGNLVADELDDEGYAGAYEDGGVRENLEFVHGRRELQEIEAKCEAEAEDGCVEAEARGEAEAHGRRKGGECVHVVFRSKSTQVEGKKFGRLRVRPVRHDG